MQFAAVHESDSGRSHIRRGADFRPSRFRRHVHRLRRHLPGAGNLLARARAHQGGAGTASGTYAWSVLFHLFFVTLMPFSMIVAGRYDLAPAIWVYGANMVLLALTVISTRS
jgi:hypothetical protein